MKNNKLPLIEVTRWDIIRRSQRESPERFQKQKFYKAKDFNGVNFEELFTNDTFTWQSRVGDYIVTISFEGAFSSLYTKVGSWSGKNRWKRLDLKLLTKCLSEALDNEDIYFDCGCPDFCLYEDTLIKSLDGNSYTVKEMLEKFNSGEDLWVYSVDENGDFKPGHVSDVWISGKSRDMIKVTLDNDKEIITTSNHLYMLRNGDYVRADELEVGQSLMPLYFKYQNGYENVMLNSKPKSFCSVYKIVANTVLQDEISDARIRSSEDIISIHHSDFNKLNNLPSNLKPMGKLEHYLYHSNHVKDNKELLDKWMKAGHDYWRTPEGRKKKSECMRENIRYFWENMSESQRKEHCRKSHAWQHTEDGHKKLSDARKRYWSSLSDDEYKSRCVENGKNLNGEHGEKTSERMKNYLENLTESEYEIRCAKCRENLSHAKVTDKCIEARRKNGKLRQRNRIIEMSLEIVNDLLSNNLQINEENFNSFRKKGYPYYQTAVSYGVFDEFNHKVKKIETIRFENDIDVYDLTVENYNNFYVDSGVILHNCYRFAYWATQVGAKYGTQQNRLPRIRNVKNNKGYCCKHVLSALYGKRWVPAAAKAWLQYIQANPEVAEEMIWG